jgi:transcriptional regulator with XRE-family HTH domain
LVGKAAKSTRLTREELAKKVGCSISVLRKIEADLLHLLVLLFSAAHETLDWKCHNQTARPVKYIFDLQFDRQLITGARASEAYGMV